MAKSSYSILSNTLTTSQKEEFTNSGVWTIPKNKGDLQYISNLLKNSIYYVSFSGLLYSFLTSNDGILYFNDNHDPLPMNCLANDHVQISIVSVRSKNQEILWTYANKKISPIIMSKKQKDKIKQIPVYNWSPSANPNECKINMVFDTHNFFPEYKAIGHWTKTHLISGGALGFAEIESSNCRCTNLSKKDQGTYCPSGRFIDKVGNNQYDGPKMLECFSQPPNKMTQINCTNGSLKDSKKTTDCDNDDISKCYDNSYKYCNKFTTAQLILMIMVGVVGLLVVWLVSSLLRFFPIIGGVGVFLIRVALLILTTGSVYIIYQNSNAK